MLKLQLGVTRSALLLAAAFGALLIVVWGVSAENDNTTLLPLVIKPQPDLAGIELELYSGGYNIPITIAHAGDERLFVGQKDGVIYIVENGTRLSTPFIDITRLTLSNGSETGLFAIAFDPDYAANGRFYLSYTDTNNHTALSRFTVSDDPDIANPEPEVLLTVEQPFWDNAGNIHSGGDLHFGADGYLYWGLGDGKLAGTDGPNRAQDLAWMLGKMIRIDVSAEPGNAAPDCIGAGNGNYAVPADNPFVDGAGGNCDEVWALGFRNPWRFSFDRLSGDLLLADVGHKAYEEINFQPAGTPGGRNYGWICYEGFDPANPVGCGPIDAYTFPVHAYPHVDSCASVTGGFVYRGSAQAFMQGYYLFADFCDGTFFATRPGNWAVKQVADYPIAPVTFGEDAAGELYVGAAGGQVFRVIGVADDP